MHLSRIYETDARNKDPSWTKGLQTIVHLEKMCAQARAAELLGHCFDLAEWHNAGVGVILEAIWTIRQLDGKNNPLRHRGLVPCLVRINEHRTGESLCSHYFSRSIPDYSRNLRSFYL